MIFAGWQPIETAPEGNAETGPFFDVTWVGESHAYLPVPARQTDCYRQGKVIVREYGYPAVTIIFGRQPTHWMIVPPVDTSTSDANAPTP